MVLFISPSRCITRVTPSNLAQYFLRLRGNVAFSDFSEPLGTKVNYLIDEAHACGKGANTVISYLHHYLNTHAPHVLQLFLHDDNCTGQNKNNYVIWYILWLALTGHNNSITLSFLIDGRPH